MKALWQFVEERRLKRQDGKLALKAGDLICIDVPDLRAYDFTISHVDVLSRYTDYVLTDHIMLRDTERECYLCIKQQTEAERLGCIVPNLAAEVDEIRQSTRRVPYWDYSGTAYGNGGDEGVLLVEKDDENSELWFGITVPLHRIFLL